MPACPPLPRHPPRALPDAGRVPAHRRCAEDLREEAFDAAVGHRGDPPLDADRLPLGRGPHPAMGRHRPRGAGHPAPRFENRPAHGAANRAGAEGAGPHRAGGRRSLGLPGGEAEVPSRLPFRALEAGQGGGRARRRAASRLPAQLRQQGAGAGRGPAGEARARSPDGGRPAGRYRAMVRKVAERRVAAARALSVRSIPCIHAPRAAPERTRTERRGSTATSSPGCPSRA